MSILNTSLEMDSIFDEMEKLLKNSRMNLKEKIGETSKGKSGKGVPGRGMLCVCSVCFYTSNISDREILKK